MQLEGEWQLRPQTQDICSATFAFIISLCDVLAFSVIRLKTEFYVMGDVDLDFASTLPAWRSAVVIARLEFEFHRVRGSVAKTQ